MKKQILFLAAAICFSITSLMAQENMQRQTPEERAKATIEKMAPLNLNAEVKAKTEVIITDFFHCTTSCYEGNEGQRKYG